VTLAYRRVYLRLFAEAPVVDGADAPDLTEVLGRRLAAYGQATVRNDGRYWKIAENVEYTVVLIPTGSVDDCVAALCATAGGWSDDVWNHRPGGSTFLHPSIVWASVAWAAAASPASFADGDIVVILDCETARDEEIVGSEAVVLGATTPATLDDEWTYPVIADGLGEVIIFAGSELQPTGRRRPPDAAQSWISVTRDGQVTAASTDSSWSP
jgi:hypothetical protein